MSDAQFRDLARSARYGILMAFPARLGVVKWPKTLLDGLDLVEGLFVGGVSGFVDQSVALVVKTCQRRLRALRGSLRRHFHLLQCRGSDCQPENGKNPTQSHDYPPCA